MTVLILSSSMSHSVEILEFRTLSVLVFRGLELSLANSGDLELLLLSRLLLLSPSFLSYRSARLFAVDLYLKLLEYTESWVLFTFLEETFLLSFLSLFLPSGSLLADTLRLTDDLYGLFVDEKLGYFPLDFDRD